MKNTMQKNYKITYGMVNKMKNVHSSEQISNIAMNYVKIPYEQNTQDKSQL